MPYTSPSYMTVTLAQTKLPVPTGILYSFSWWNGLIWTGLPATVDVGWQFRLQAEVVNNGSRSANAYVELVVTPPDGLIMPPITTPIFVLPPGILTKVELPSFVLDQIGTYNGLITLWMESL